MERKKRGERSGKREREREGGVREREGDVRERDRWGSEWLRKRGRLKKREGERERYEESMRIGKERKSP